MLQSKVKNLQEEIVNIEDKYRMAIEEYRSQEKHTNYEYSENTKRRAEYEEQLLNKVREVEREICRLGENLAEAKETELKFLIREEENRLELEQVKHLYSEANIHIV